MEARTAQPGSRGSVPFRSRQAGASSGYFIFKLQFGVRPQAIFRQALDLAVLTSDKGDVLAALLKRISLLQLKTAALLFLVRWQQELPDWYIKPAVLRLRESPVYVSTHEDLDGEAPTVSN